MKYKLRAVYFLCDPVAKLQIYHYPEKCFRIGYPLRGPHFTQGASSLCLRFCSLLLRILESSKMRLRGAGPEQNIITTENLWGTPHDAIQPGHWVYAKPNPQHKHSAWLHGVVESVLANVIHCRYPSWKDTQKSSTDQIGCCSTH